MVGIVGVVGLFSMFGYAGLQIAQRAKDNYGKLLVAGLTSLILVQATINLFAVMGLAPLTGVPLPFVSYGNSSLLATPVRGRADPQRRPRRHRPRRRASERSHPRWQTARRRGRARARARKESIERCQKASRVVVAAGGTAGHVVPAMAVAAELRASGAEVTFLGTRERIEAELVPAAGYEIDFLKVRGIDRRNPLRAAGAAAEALRRGRRGAAGDPAPRRRRRHGRRRLRRRPGGPGRGPHRHAAGPDRGRQPPRPRQPPAGEAGAARLPRLPDRGQGGRALPGHRPAGARRGAERRPRRRPGARFGIPAEAALPAGDGRQPGRPLDQLRRGRGLRRARRPRLPRHPPRRPARLRGAGAAPRRRAPRRPLHPARLRARPRRRPCRLRPGPGRSGGSIFELTAAGRPAILVPYPHATADHQSANAAWMARPARRGAARSRSRGARAPSGCGGGRPRARRRRAPGGDGGASASLAHARRGPPHRRRGPGRRRLARCTEARLGRPPAPLHRDRRRRDERAGAGLRPARRERQRQRPQPTPLIWSACARPASTRSSATTPPTCPRAPRSSSRPRSATTTRSWRSLASAARG